MSKAVLDMYREIGKARGYTDTQIAALAGNVMAESSFNPKAFNPGDNARSKVHKDSIGYMQWNDTRAVALKNLAAKNGVDWSDTRTQIQHTFNELDGVESRAGRMLRASTNMKDAAIAAISFVRPQGYTNANPTDGHNFAKRLAGGRAVEQAYATGDYSQIKSARPSSSNSEDSNANNNYTAKSVVNTQTTIDYADIVNTKVGDVGVGSGRDPSQISWLTSLAPQSIYAPYNPKPIEPITNVNPFELPQT